MHSCVVLDVRGEFAVIPPPMFSAAPSSLCTIYKLMCGDTRVCLRHDSGPRVSLRHLPETCGEIYSMTGSVDPAHQILPSVAYFNTGR